MTYDPVAFWEADAHLLAGPGAASPEHERQEALLEPLLARLKWATVLEVGVGGGRITDLLHRIRPDAAYTGLDLGRVQLDRATAVWGPDAVGVQSLVEDFGSAGNRWDLVVMTEVLMHVTPDRIAEAVRNVMAATHRHLVIVEWVPEPPELDQPIAPWNFPHDYRALFAADSGMRLVSETKTDRQVIFRLQR
jgi:SAM-dependent methyltransferase